MSNLPFPAGLPALLYPGRKPVGKIKTSSVRNMDCLFQGSTIDDVSKEMPAIVAQTEMVDNGLHVYGGTKISAGGFISYDMDFNTKTTILFKVKLLEDTPPSGSDIIFTKSYSLNSEPYYAIHAVRTRAEALGAWQAHISINGVRKLYDIGVPGSILKGDTISSAISIDQDKQLFMYIQNGGDVIKSETTYAGSLNNYDTPLTIGANGANLAQGALAKHFEYFRVFDYYMDAATCERILRDPYADYVPV